MDEQRKTPLYMYEFVKKKVDLAEFLETELGCHLNWYEPHVSAGTLCPMPKHQEAKPSFRLKFIEEDGLWIYHCLGCGAKGTVIDFFMEYYGIPTSAQAVLAICHRFNIKDSSDLAIKSLGDVKKRVNFQKKMEMTHIVTSNQCRNLLRKDLDRYSKWVATAYQKMNIALENEDIATIEAVGMEASSKMME
jgi:DNA primase